MKKQVLFIHGGGDDGYGAGKKMVASLQKALGKDHEITYPEMRWDDAPDFGWLQQIGAYIDQLKDDAVWIGHSLGASLLLKYLSENKISKKAAGLFLIAPPFWSGKEEWKQGLILRKDFAETLPKNIPVYLYHCQDDEEVPNDHITKYRHKLRDVTFREMETGGHLLDDHLDEVSKDIKAL